MPARRSPTSTRALSALASPVRQEVVDAFADGPASVKDLAHRLGRSRPALHYHVEQLLRAGILAAAGTRGTGRTKEQLYHVPRDVVALAARRTPVAMKAADRAASALVRLTGRELRRAIQHQRTARGSNQRAVIAARSRCRLDAAGLGEVTALVERLSATLRQRRVDSGAPLYSVTIVLTPVAEPSRRAP